MHVIVTYCLKIFCTAYYTTQEVWLQVVLCNAIETTQYCDTEVVVLTSKFGIVGIDYAI